MDRRVKGSLFVDYVRTLRSYKTTDWSRSLRPEDTSYLVRRIEPDEWYPMVSFERMGLAILDEVAHGDLETVRGFGRVSIDWLCQRYPKLLAVGDPRDSLMRFHVLRRTFFEYAALEMPSVSDGEASVLVHYGMSARAQLGVGGHPSGRAGGLGRGACAEHRSVCVAIRPGGEDLEVKHHDGDGEAARRQDRVEQQYVDDVRGDDRESQGHEAIREQERAGDHFDALDEREHVPRRREGTQERPCLVGDRGLGHELQESVQAEDEEDQPKEDPGRRGSKTRDRVHGFSSFPLSVFVRCGFSSGHDEDQLGGLSREHRETRLVD